MASSSNHLRGIKRTGEEGGGGQERNGGIEREGGGEREREREGWRRK